MINNGILNKKYINDLSNNSIIKKQDIDLLLK